MLIRYRKHQKRHERPYECTFCDKTFGSKADWKRHEYSQHIHQQGWDCDLQDSNQDELLPLQEHADDVVKTVPDADELGQNGRLRFWCGFCQVALPVRGHGTAAWNERFDHIDSQHFKKGQRKDEWLAPSGHSIKEQDPEVEDHEEDMSEDDGDSSSGSGDEETNYEESQALDIATPTDISSKKRKSSAVESYPLGSLGESKKRGFDIQQPERLIDTVNYPKRSLSLEPGPETVSCVRIHSQIISEL